jgi:hypothetical protein
MDLDTAFEMLLLLYAEVVSETERVRTMFFKTSDEETGQTLKTMQINKDIIRKKLLEFYYLVQED